MKPIDAFFAEARVCHALCTMGHHGVAAERIADAFIEAEALITEAVDTGVHDARDDLQLLELQRPGVQRLVHLASALADLNTFAALDTERIGLA